ncbi:MAG: DUF3108 domain-containing protein [Rhodoferax sp.]
MLALLATVLLLHAMALDWLQGQGTDSLPFIAMPAPLLLRALAVQAPARPPRSPAPTRPLAPVQPVQMAAQVGQTIANAPVDARVPAPAPEPTEPTPAADGGSEPALAGLPDSQAPAPGAAGADWPADTRLGYALQGYYRGNLYGSAQVQWQRHQGSYQVQVDMRLALLLTLGMTSQGEFSPSGLLPRLYEERFLGSVRRIRMDGVAVVFHDGGALRQPEGLQDTASQFVELTQRFASGRQALEVGTPVSLWLARPNGMNLWTYDVVALDTLQLPQLGVVAAFHLQPRPVANPRGVITADMWFAPSLQYLPVRIRVDLGEGNFVDLLAERIEQAQPEQPAPP